MPHLPHVVTWHATPPHVVTWPIFTTQVLILYDSVDQVDVEGVVKFVSNLQQPDGSFVGDQWGETMDTHKYSELHTKILYEVVE